MMNMKDSVNYINKEDKDEGSMMFQAAHFYGDDMLMLSKCLTTTIKTKKMKMQHTMKKKGASNAPLQG